MIWKLNYWPILQHGSCTLTTSNLNLIKRNTNSPVSAMCHEINRTCTVFSIIIVCVQYIIKPKDSNFIELNLLIKRYNYAKTL